MSTEQPAGAAWYRAMNLPERIAARPPAAQGGAGAPPADDERGRRRLERWRALPPFGSGDHFARRLEMDGVTEAELVRLLGEPDEAIAARFAGAPPWMDTFAAAYAAAPEGDDAPLSLPSDLEGNPHVAWLAAAMPLIRRSRARLAREVEALAARPDSPLGDAARVEALCARTFAHRLVRMTSRTMVLELNVARLQGQLEGDDTRARFGSFVERLRRPETVLPLFEEYPVLARQLCLVMDQWEATSLAFLRRLCDDWPELLRRFGAGADPGPLVELEGTESDRHRGGQSVMIATFRSGLRIVYKPKPLAVDVHFQELLGWLNQRGQQPALRVTQTLDRGSYGWSEFITAGECASADGIERFYRRQGSYLAVMYLLQATDFHFENIIAMGEHPVLVDLESLFHPHFLGQGRNDASEMANAFLGNSVLRVGMLPERSWTDNRSSGIDVSALGGTALQMSPRPVQYWAGAGTDEMRIDRKPLPLEGGLNRPTLKGADVDVMEYYGVLVEGFRSTYRLLLAHREQLLDEGGPLAAFHDDEVRIILRPTHLYSLLQRESYHPDMLRDALDRDSFFDRLWVNVEQTAFLARVIPAERDDLWREDFPLFTTRPASLDLWTSAGECIPGFFSASGMSLVRERLAGLSDDDLRRQLWLIQASFTALAVGGDDAVMPSYALAEPAGPASRGQLLGEAAAIGDRLAELALWGSESVAWVGLSPIHERYWNLAPLGPDLYSGLPGVAIFLAYLGEATGDARYRRLAEGTLPTLRHQVEHDLWPRATIGAFGGWGGLIYAYTHLGSLWDRPDLHDLAEALVESLPARVDRDDRFDLIDGAAGCLLSLLALHQVRPSAATLAVAARCGERLLEAAVPAGPGIGWTTPLGPEPLAGISHGAAGIAWALLALAGATGEARFREAGLASLAYERSLFSPGAGNWPDLREGEAPGSFICAWCQGAPGIGLSRLAMLPYLDTPEARAEVETAVRTTLAVGFGRNHSLCHGDLGNLELVALAGRMGVGSARADEVERLGAMVLQGIQRHGRLCGVPLGVETPGLMSGLAGIGYGLLRLAAPDRVPSVLTLEPPLPAAVAALAPYEVDQPPAW